VPRNEILYRKPVRRQAGCANRPQKLLIDGSKHSAPESEVAQ